MATQKPWQLSILVLSGGGLKGTAFLGALQEISNQLNKDIFSHPPVTCGSSVGALICLASQLGYTLEEAREIMEQLESKTLCPALYTPGMNRPSLLKEYALDYGEGIDSFLATIFKKKNSSTKITFKQLYQKTKRLLLVTGSSVTCGKAIYFSVEHTPNMKVYEAVRISMRIPFLFPPIKWRNQVLIDGNFFDPFPVRGLSSKILKEARKGNILGILVSQEKKSHLIDSLFPYLTKILYTMVNQLSTFAAEQYKKQIITIPFASQAVTFDIPKKVMLSFFKKGKYYAQQFLLKRGLPILSQYVVPHKKLLVVPDQPDKVARQNSKAPLEQGVQKDHQQHVDPKT